MTIVVVSTHLDDAVLSCWSIVAGDADVTVVTVFTGSPEDPNLVTDWDRDTGLTSKERMAARIDENRAALAVAGRSPIDLGFLESQYGGRSIDAGVLAERLRDAELVYLPAGTGVPGDVSTPSTFSSGTRVWSYVPMHGSMQINRIACSVPGSNHRHRSATVTRRLTTFF